MINIGKAVTQLLKESDKDQKWLIEEMGITQSTASKFMNSRHVSLSNIEKIAEAFDIKEWELIKKAGE